MACRAGMYGWNLINPYREHLCSFLHCIGLCILHMVILPLTLTALAQSRSEGLGEAVNHRVDLVHRSILAIDIERSTARTNLVKLELRRQIYKLLGEAMAAAGIKDSHCEPLADRGDGVLVLIHPLD